MRRLTVPITFLASLAALLFVLPSLDGQRVHGDMIIAPGEKPSAVEAAPEDFIEGNYWALIIGISKYPTMDKDKQLEAARKDAAAVAKLLEERYGFSRERMIELYDEQATKKKIIRAFSSLARRLTDKDSLFIYYAGHGEFEASRQTRGEKHIVDGMGYWIFSDAELDDPASYIFNSQVRDFMAAIPARHIYAVVDSAFSGSLMQKTPAVGLSKSAIHVLYQEISRWVLTSGGLYPVPAGDKSKSGHSAFAWHFMKILEENTNPYLLAKDIAEPISVRVPDEVSGQFPRSAPVLGAGDEGGQFVFRLRKEFQKESVALDSADGARREAKEAKPVEQFRVRPFDALQQLAPEIIGKDEAPLALVPAGEFLMGSDDGNADEKPAHRVYLDYFYIDKYEVTTSRYARFLKETGREPPDRWNEVKLPDDGDRPVIGVSWRDAERYCRWAGKRLPTEAEWEKAARGTDGRKYPWGNEEPTSRHANFGKDKWNGYSTLSKGGSLEDGKSPYGIYDMAGNVWEWVADWYGNYQVSPDRNPTVASSGAIKVFRGGSWANAAVNLRSTVRFHYFVPLRSDFVGFRCAQDAPK